MESSSRSALLGRDIMFEYLVEQEIPYMFGNPGTTEITFVDGCNDYPVEYVLSLHEDVAVAQAMGYARASGKVGVVNLHVTPGVAHGLGNLYNAYHARIPLLVTAGQHHPALNLQEPILTGNLVELVRPFTKWAYEVSLADELPVAMQRAFKELNTPPYGPVFLSVGTSVFMEKIENPPPARVSRIGAIGSDPAELKRAAGALAEAKNPVIIAGDAAGQSGAWDELVSLAESLGAVVHSEGYSTSWNFPSNHPLYGGPLSNRANLIRGRFDDVDVVLMCGVTCQVPVSRYDEGGPLVPWRVRAISVDDNPWEIGKNGPVEVGLIGDIKRNLGALADAVREAAPDVVTVRERTRTSHAYCAKRVEHWAEQVRVARESDAITGTLVAAELRDRWPAGAVFVDESISNRPAFVNVLQFDDTLSYFAANGLSLGYSAGAAVGINLALPDRRVVNVVGDGSLMYYPQALWNAAATNTPVLFLVLNNASYKVLKLITDRMGGPWAADGSGPPGLDLDQSRVDFVELAASMGVAGELASTPEELRAALDRGMAATGPYLVEIALQD